MLNPRIEKVPIKIPLPRKSDSIYTLQKKKIISNQLPL